MANAVQSITASLKKSITQEKKMVLKTSGGTSFTVPFAPQETEVTMGTDWQVSTRTGRNPVYQKSGMKSHTMSMTFILGKRDQGSIWTELSTLRGMAKSDDYVQIIYTSNESGLWRITDFNFNILFRNVHNNPSRATVNMTFSRVKSGTLNSGPATGGKKPKAAAKPKKSKKKTRTYKVKKGDTLWAISLRYYKTGSKWTKIADANKITNPRKLKIGKTLRIP